MIIKLELSIEEMNIVFEGLENLPYKKVAKLAAKLLKECNEQVEKQKPIEPPKAEET